MPKSLQLRRYPTSTLSAITGLSGELIIDTTNNIITVHDGVTAGGWKTLANTTSITTAGDFTVSGNLFVTGTSTIVSVLPQATTAAAPVYIKGGMYFDTTLNKMRIGGATAWETVTSS